MTSDFKSYSDDFLAQPNERLKANDSNIIGEFARSAAYSAIQKPVRAVAQVFDKVTGSKVADNISLVDKPADTEFGSLNWHAQQAGGAIGSVVPFLASYALTKRMSNALGAEQTALDVSKASAATTASYFRTGEMATAGFIQGAAFEPNQNKDNMLRERLVHGIASGASMGAMHVMSNRLSDFTGANLSRATIVDRALTTGLAGAGGGVVGFGVSGLFGETPLTLNEGMKSAYQGAFAGAVLGGAYSDALRLHQPKSNLPHLENFVAQNKGLKLSDDNYFEWKADNMKVKGQDRGNGLGFERFSPLDRVELIAKLQRDADPFMARPDVVKSFLDTVEPAFTTDLRSNIEAIDKNIDKQIAMSEAKHFEEKDFQSPQDARDYGAIRRLEKKAEKEHDELADLREKFQEEVRERLEFRINDFLDEQGMPLIRLELERGNSDGAANYAFGRVGLSEDAFRFGEPSSTVLNSIYHELTHLRQEVDQITQLADKMQLPKNPSPEQVEVLQKTVLTELLQARGAHGKELDRMLEEAQTKEDLESFNDLVENVVELRRSGVETRSGFHGRFGVSVKDSATSYFKDRYSPAQRSFEKLEYQLGDVDNALRNLTPDSIQRILTEVKMNPAQFKDTYGFNSIPRVLRNLANEHAASGLQIADIDTPLSSAQWKYYDGIEPQVKDAFAKHLPKLEARSKSARSMKAEQYFNNAGEKEAFATANLAELTKAYEDARF